MGRVVRELLYEAIRERVGRRAQRLIRHQTEVVLTVGRLEGGAGA
jgi:hypothetical protein